MVVEDAVGCLSEIADAGACPVPRHVVEAGESDVWLSRAITSKAVTPWRQPYIADEAA